jgi:DNA-binding NarL/FixJ family response regulator
VLLSMRGEAQPAARKIRVMLVDDEPMVRQGLTLLLELEPDLLVCGAEESETEAAQRIPRLNPDVVVVDLCLKQGTGLNLIKQLRHRCPKLKIIVFSMYDQAHYVGRAFAVGAHGYITKEEGGERLVEAIHTVMGGKFYLSEEMAARTPSLLPGPAPRHTRRHV